MGGRDPALSAEYSGHILTSLGLSLHETVR